MMIGIIIFCCLIGIFASWKGARIALFRKKKHLAAYEAKMISETFDSKMKNIENRIYDDIRTSAFCGNRYVKSMIDKDIEISHETISSRLKQNGYIVSWSFSKDHNAYVYEIQW